MQILELLRQASHKRPEAVRQFDLYRAFDGAADGVAELFIDRIGPFGVVHLLGENAQARAMEEAIGHIGAELAALLQVTTIYCRIHDRDPKSTSSRAAKILFGPPVPSAIVMEHGLRFLVRPEENVNAGIFLDTRAVRQKLLTLSAGAEVLNTFAFTGSLGVAAYCGGPSR